MASRLCVFAVAASLLLGCSGKSNGVQDEAGSLADQFWYFEKYRRTVPARKLDAHMEKVDYESVIKIKPLVRGEVENRGGKRDRDGDAEAGAPAEAQAEAKAVAEAEATGPSQAQRDELLQLLRAARKLAESNAALRRTAASASREVTAAKLNGPLQRRRSAIEEIERSLQGSGAAEGAPAGPGADEAVREVFPNGRTDSFDADRFREVLDRKILEFNAAVDDWNRRYGNHLLNIRAFAVTERGRIPVSVHPYSNVKSDLPLKPAIFPGTTRPQEVEKAKELEKAAKQAATEVEQIRALEHGAPRRGAAPERGRVSPLREQAPPRGSIRQDELRRRLGLPERMQERRSERPQGRDGRTEDAPLPALRDTRTSFQQAPAEPAQAAPATTRANRQSDERQTPEIKETREDAGDQDVQSPTQPATEDMAEKFVKAVAEAEAEEPVAPTVDVENVDFPLRDAPVGEINLAGAVDRGDKVVVQFRLTPPPGQDGGGTGDASAAVGNDAGGGGDDATKATETPPWASRWFDVDRMDLSYTWSGNLIFINRIGSEGKQSGVPDDFVPAPAASLILHYRPRSDPWPQDEPGRFFSNLLEEVDPGLGLHVAAIAFEEDSGGGQTGAGAAADDDKLELGVGVGVQFSFFRDILQVGYGYNLMADNHPHYWFVGIGVFEAFNEFGRLGRDRKAFGLEP